MTCRIRDVQANAARRSARCSTTARQACGVASIASSSSRWRVHHGTLPRPAGGRSHRPRRHVPRELPDGLEQPVERIAVADVAVVELHEALVDESAHQVEDLHRSTSPSEDTTASAAASVKRPANAREAAEDELFGVVEQIVAPCDRGEQRLLAGSSALEPPVRRRKASSSSAAMRSGASWRQRAATSSMASGTPSSRWQIWATAAAWMSVRPRRGRAQRARSRKAARRRAARAARSTGPVPTGGSWSDGTRHTTSPGSPSSPRRGHDAQLGAAGEQLLRGARRHVEQVLAVVEHRAASDRPT